MIERSHEGRSVLLARIEGKVYAMDNICNHMGACLHEGEIGREGKYLVTCPWHEAHFDVRTGKVEQDIAWAEDNAAFAVEIDGDEVLVEL